MIEKYQRSTVFFLNVIFFTVFLSVLKQFFNKFFFEYIYINTFFLGVVLSFVFDWLQNGRVFSWCVSVCNLILLVVLVFLSSLVSDTWTWDGTMYHKPAMYVQYSSQNLLFSKIQDSHFWSYVYPKLTGIFSGELAIFLGEFSALSAYNFIFAAGASFYLVYFLKRIKLRKIFIFAITFICIFNTIALMQVFSTYVDSTVGYLILLIFLSASLISINRNSSLDWYVLVISCSLIINIKFSGFLYVGVAFLYLGIVRLRSKKLIIELLSNFTFFIVLGILVLGWNPYINNILNDYHIFHPLFGSEKIDIMTSNTPPDLRKMGQFQKLFYSTFSKSDAFSIDLKEPFSIYESEFQILSESVDLRVGGFGPFFPLILIISVILLCLSFKLKHQDIRLPLIIMCTMAILLNPEAWWARYNAPLYFLCAFTLMFPVKPQINLKFIMYLSLIFLFFAQIIIFIPFKYHNLWSIKNNWSEKLKSINETDIYIYDDYIDIENIEYHNLFKISPNKKFIYSELGVEPHIIDKGSFICLNPKEINYTYQIVKFCLDKDLYDRANISFEQGDLLYELDLYGVSAFDGYSSEVLNVSRGLNFFFIKEDGVIDYAFNIDPYSDSYDNIGKIKELISRNGFYRVLIIGIDTLVKSNEISDVIHSNNIFNDILGFNKIPYIGYRQSFFGYIDNNEFNFLLGNTAQKTLILFNKNNKKINILKGNNI